MCGYMENRTKSLTKKQKAENKKTQEVDLDAVTGDTQVDGNANLVSADADMQNLIDQMKSVVIDDNNLEEIKADLRVSREYRCKMLLNPKTDLLESYPYFFTNVDLVCYHSLGHFTCKIYNNIFVFYILFFDLIAGFVRVL